MQPTATSWSCGVVVITSALHAEGPQFDPGRDQQLLLPLYSEQFPQYFYTDILSTWSNCDAACDRFSQRCERPALVGGEMLLYSPAWLSGLGV